ncbi:methylated-DNA--[protein]-cysteine S-methyltransferase [Enemella evansiae]|uniref:Methylated-DNA--protein-cysteine methyltransferase n=1 Tax=Enemella evansiae TaxID=2016499 RepID=A0A255GSV8_9ACTN|nr:methylated-DNA--[protein]-cysteine S-methyltransferase [Enemella evansiae]OYN97029.1 cysteine methyltransferase [Enemella evansiae]OYO06129.1 cysteine methyltransferase [Enemella evansiae]OYO17736.1 cysteine methyltransferase [Enemella evansiae]PFG68851.1 methylated-DNA-[protein]-cysteine S-methyltransferase [Propionibacteriaceae bacterium ES.041]
MRYAEIDTTLGALTVVADRVDGTDGAGGAGGAEQVVGIYFPGHWTNPDRRAWGEPSAPDGVIEQVRAELSEYAAGARQAFTVPIELRGNAFQQQIWAELLQIPYGETTSYGALAARVGVRNAQLVGQAVGHNPISVIVPCHRVVGADGSLTGYAGGVDRKVWLLEREGALPGSLFGDAFDEAPTFSQA